MSAAHNGGTEQRNARLEAAVPALRQMRGAGIDWQAFADDLESLLREHRAEQESQLDDPAFYYRTNDGF